MAPPVSELGPCRRLLAAPTHASLAKGLALPILGSSKQILQLQPRWKASQEARSEGRRRMSSGDEVQRGTCHEQHKGMVNIFPQTPRAFLQAVRAGYVRSLTDRLQRTAKPTLRPAARKRSRRL